MIEVALFLNATAFAVLVMFLFSSGYLSIYSGLFIYVLFHFLVFVERPFVVYIFDFRGTFDYMKYMPTDDVFVETILVSNVGLFSFVLFYLLAMRFEPVRPNFQLPPISPIERSSFYLALMLLAPMMAYSFILAFTVRQAVGNEVLDELGKLNMTIDPATGRTLYADTTAYVVGARDFAFAFGAYLIHSARGRWWSYIPILFSALVALQLGERWPIVIAGLVAILMTLYLNKRSTFTTKQYAAVTFVLVLFVLVGQHREAFVKFLLTGQLSIDFNPAQSSFGDHFDFANFDFLTYIVAKVPDVSKTYSYFTQYLGALTQPIPRVLWPDKPVGSPVTWVNLEAYGHFTSLTTSLVGDGWISLGYAGVIVTCGAVGAFYGWLFRRFCGSSVSIYFYCAYFWIDALLVQWARDGGYTILTFLGFSAGPVALAYGLSIVLGRMSGRSHNAS